MSESLSPHADENRRVWDESHSDWFAQRAERQWAAEPHWGVWAIPDDELHVLPDVDGKDLIDLGCGTGYIGAWTLRRGGRPVGVDNSAAQSLEGEQGRAADAGTVTAH